MTSIISKRHATIILSLFLILACGIYYYQHSRPEIYIAVAGPMSGPNASSGEEMVDAISMRINDVNQQGGIAGSKVKLLTFDDKNDATTATTIAREIANDDRILLVLGHYFSSTSMAAGSVYKQRGIPAITASATADEVARGNEWYYQTIFNNTYQGAFLAQFIHKILGFKRACIILDDDAYGSTLSHAFSDEAGTIGLEITSSMAFSQHSPTLADDINRCATISHEQDKDTIIFLATHALEGAKLVMAIRSRNQQTPIIGADALSSEVFMDRLRQTPQERARPGFFSNDIHVVAPYIPDISTRQAQYFRNEFRRHYGKHPSWVAAGYFDVAGLSMQALQSIVTTNEDLTTTTIRQKICAYLIDLSNPLRAYPGVACNIFFDQNGNAVRPLRIGRYQDQQLLSDFAHVDVIFNHESNLDKLLDQALKNNVLFLNDSLMKRIQIVYTGIQFNEITGLDINKSTFAADFYLWFRFQGPFDDRNIEFLNAASEVNLGEPVIEETVNGVTKRVYRIRATFKGNFNLAKYPFDSQKLEITMSHRKSTTQDVIFVTDLHDMKCYNIDNWLKNMKVNGVFSGIQAWDIEDAWLYQNVQNTFISSDQNSDRGSYAGIGFSQFNVEIEIQRNFISHAVKNLIPIIAIVIASYSTFFIKMNEASMFSLRFNIMMSSLLTLSFFHLKLSNDLPEIDYLVAMEYGFFVLYFLFAFGMLDSVLCRHFVNRGRLDLVARFSNFGKGFYPLVIIATVVTMYFVYIR